MSDTNLVVRPVQPAIGGMASVGVAFKRALVSQCHTEMLTALDLPFTSALNGAIIVLSASWTQLTAWLNPEACNCAVVDQVDEWMLAIGVFSIKLYLIPLLAVVILLPISGILGLII